ncbi:MAG: o-succinylbenzoate--CoA ligase [Steroidobacteraceae bacterium]
MNLVARIMHFGKMRAAAPALIEGDRTITYGELAGLVHRTAVHLGGQGLRRGDRVGLCLKDTAQHAVVLLGATLMGAVAVPLDYRARPNENARYVDALGLACVLCEPETPLGGSVLRVDQQWHHRVGRIGAHADVEWPGEWDDPFVISATSGSTGAPQFSQMTHRQHGLATARMFELMHVTGRHRYLCTLPLYFSGGRNSCIGHLLRGDCVVLYPSLFGPDEYVDVTNREHITIGIVVPSVVRQLLAAAGSGRVFAARSALYCTGAPLHAEEKRRAARVLTPNFYDRYGTAETMVIAVLHAQDFDERAESIGRTHPGMQIEVVDESDQPLPPRSVGRWRIRGPGIATPLSSSEESVNFRGEWYYPGDIAHVDEGYIYLHSRTSDAIVRGGAKVYPAEIEAALGAHSDVLEVAVLGHRGADQEETIVAFVVARKTLLAGELLGYCRARLTAHKVPRQIRFLDRLPRTTAGKVDKASLARGLADAIIDEGEATVTARSRRVPGTARP